MGTVKEGRTSQVGEDDTRPCEDDGDDLTEDGELQVPDERMVLALLVEVGEKWRGRSKRERGKEGNGGKEDRPCYPASASSDQRSPIRSSYRPVPPDRSKNETSHQLSTLSLPPSSLGLPFKPKLELTSLIFNSCTLASSRILPFSRFRSSLTPACVRVICSRRAFLSFSTSERSRSFSLRMSWTSCFSSSLSSDLSWVKSTFWAYVFCTTYHTTQSRRRWGGRGRRA
jgi:hypothetical protein